MAKLFYYSALSVLPSENYAQKLLKVHYLQKLRKHDPVDKSTENTRCTKCYSAWTDGDYKLKIIPITKRNHAKNVRRLAKLELLNVKNDKKLEWVISKLRDATTHRTELTCNICRKKAKFTMKKVKKANTTTSKPPQMPQQSTKKRKKVPFAGLNPDIINRNKVKNVNAPKLANTKPVLNSTKKTSVPAKNSVLDLAKMLKAKKR